MERVIRFRGKDILTGDWVYGSLIYDEFNQKYFIFESEPSTFSGDMEGRYTEVDPKTVGEFTNERDINDGEIYEGDILRLESYLDDRVFAVPVIFKNSMWEAEGSGWLTAIVSVNNGVVIGNIHDNRDMIKR